MEVVVFAGDEVGGGAVQAGADDAQRAVAVPGAGDDGLDGAVLEAGAEAFHGAVGGAVGHREFLGIPVGGDENRQIGREGARNRRTAGGMDDGDGLRGHDLAFERDGIAQDGRRRFLGGDRQRDPSPGQRE